MTDRHSEGIPRRNGIRVDPAKDREWRNRSQRRAADKQQRKLRLRSTQSPRSSATVVRRQARKQTAGAGQTDWSDEVRAQAYERSGRQCEAALPGCHGRACRLHHRKLRRHGDHTIANALDVCLHCHDVIHRMGDAAVDKGLLLKARHSPATVSVLRRGARVLLNLDGSLADAA